ncbi:tRNA (adenosine(37)-N6)-dimethylallyltransferase MiaA [Porphyromonas sp.]|uniref:tRNA (adenosine(37)-N6)-dimethylallyltransferase MiaA n=1 Tax=Porphyromonas sp. TaxID=1924944 RepID=UPI0026DA99F1|nr:tRNA (adenosine(37)-N6)-dimethylallyltransferase MiaA [Porphyromonas sp.]MDO4695604.1 tRNA (adenosine(37)-N6)-dimethylallyltransferase MiaA [Porphyromonas sp.]MDO4771550.1 tRNA (adenosine(37)-N6)-dimethylallyltransferase MiaA [Porphyromonas sp.]
MATSDTLITIMGPTASGKTSVATHLAYLTGGVVLSGDSRQVYRGMDIGTGKDLSDYAVNGCQIPYYLIDICDPGEKYNIYRFKQDFYNAFSSIPHSQPKIFCGGSGLYMEAVLGEYYLPDVPENKELRKTLEGYDLPTLIKKLSSYGPLHNKTDIENKKRVIRAIEIAEYRATHPISSMESNYSVDSKIFVIDIDREVRRARISSRLKTRLSEGLIEEVQTLLDSGISADDLIYYGLEYKFVTEYVIGQRSFEDMARSLEIAIHQFAKRQMTWLRGMARRGFVLTYVKPQDSPMDTAEIILETLVRDKMLTI